MLVMASTMMTVGFYKALSPSGRAEVNLLLQRACTMARIMNFDLHGLYVKSQAGEFVATNILVNAMIKLTDPSHDVNREDTSWLKIISEDAVLKTLEIMDANLSELLERVTQPTNPKVRAFWDGADLIKAISHAAWKKQFAKELDEAENLTSVWRAAHPLE